MRPVTPFMTIPMDLRSIPFLPNLSYSYRRLLRKARSESAF